MIQVNKYAKNMQNKLDPYGSTYGIRHINHSSPKTYCQLQWIRSYIYINKNLTFRNKIKKKRKQLKIDWMMFI